MKIPKLVNIFNRTYRYFWNKSVNNLQLRLTDRLQWDIDNVQMKFPCTVRFHKSRDNYFHQIDFNPKNITYKPTHKMTLRNHNKYIKIAALDPGIRTFQTLYDTENTIIEFGPGDIYKGDINVSKIHRSICNYLISNYNIVLIPKLELQTNDSNYYKWRHIEFVDLLLKSSRFSNCNVVIVDEAWTSKTCTNCGFINDPGHSKTYNCIRCGLEIDRDFNGARNILIKNMEHIGLSIRKI